MKIQLKRWNNYLSALFGLCWILFIAYRILYGNPLYSLSYLISPLLLAIIFVLLVSLIKHMEQISIIKRVNRIVDILYWKPLISLFDITFKRMPGIGDVLMLLGRFIISSRSLTVFTFFYFATSLIPSVCLVSCFWVQVFLHVQISRIVFILLISYLIFFRFIIFLIRDFAIHNLKDMETIFSVELRNINGSIKEVLVLRPEKLESCSNKREHYVKLYILFKNMRHLSDIYISITNKDYYVVIQIWVKFIYLIGFIKLFLSYNEYYISTEFYILSLYFLFLFVLFNINLFKK